MTTDVGTPVSPEEELARFESMKWKKEPDDPRDYLLHQYHPEIVFKSLQAAIAFDLRNSIYRPFVPPGGNQTSLGSCVYWATGRGYRYAQRRNGFPDFDVSELFGYYEGRKIRGWINEDSGSYLRDAMEVYSKIGVAEEQYWPYDVSRFREQPPQTAYENAATHQATRYIKIPDGDDASIDAVIEAGWPVCFGIPIYENFPFSNGVRTIPEPQGRVIGGHAMWLCAYDKSRQKRTLLNQWGDAWGEDGFAEISYQYFKQAQDLWYIEGVEGQILPPPPPPPPVKKTVDGIGVWTRNKATGVITPVVHLWPPRPYEEMEDEVGGIGVHFTDGTIADTGLL